jgi:hypothetical protein
MDFHTRERSRRNYAHLLRVIGTGASGDAKAVQKLFDELMKYGQ